jgi:hypothetical protein
VCGLTAVSWISACAAAESDGGTCMRARGTTMAVDAAARPFKTSLRFHRLIEISFFIRSNEKDCSGNRKN